LDGLFVYVPLCLNVFEKGKVRKKKNNNERRKHRNEGSIRRMVVVVGEGGGEHMCALVRATTGHMHHARFLLE
jgi:hypothetical protein